MHETRETLWIVTRKIPTLVFSLPVRCDSFTSEVNLDRWIISPNFNYRNKDF